jgi:hypothetical protein
MLRNLMVRGYFSAIAASFNLSFERDSPEAGESLNFKLDNSEGFYGKFF